MKAAPLVYGNKGRRLHSSAFFTPPRIPAPSTVLEQNKCHVLVRNGELQEDGEKMYGSLENILRGCVSYWRDVSTPRFTEEDAVAVIDGYSSRFRKTRK